MTFRQPRAQPAPAHGGGALSGPPAPAAAPHPQTPAPGSTARTARSRPQKNCRCLKSSEQSRSLKNPSPAAFRAAPLRLTRAPKEKASGGRGHDSVRLAFLPAERGTTIGPAAPPQPAAPGRRTPTPLGKDPLGRAAPPRPGASPPGAAGRSIPPPGDAAPAACRRDPPPPPPSSLCLNSKRKSKSNSCSASTPVMPSVARGDTRPVPAPGWRRRSPRLAPVGPAPSRGDTCCRGWALAPRRWAARPARRPGLRQR